MEDSGKSMSTCKPKFLIPWMLQSSRLFQHGGQMHLCSYISSSIGVPIVGHNLCCYWLLVLLSLPKLTVHHRSAFQLLPTNIIHHWLSSFSVLRSLSSFRLMLKL